ncbi:hypothetical protein COU79_03155 [Candidatus Peregrinibacteria bacterium CG10_big_fil_rev_8_21_14_0_10_54_7]|nr:MAG: hypothetical protein COU79_03155 [Candidatus Peregrinibacteria bacterium CG10_big_fil_rev_8_21_14_0_10_54_7]
MVSKRTAGQRFTFSLFALFGLIILLRFYNLDARTINIDEGMGLRYGQMLLDGTWRYNPYNSHGPIYFFFTSFMYGVFGDSIVIARAGMSVVSVVWFLLVLWLYWPLLRAPGRLVLAAGLGLSSGMVFFARDFIHEHIFILMTVGALIAAEMWIRHRDYRAPATFIILCVLMYTTKETALLTWAAWGVTAVLMATDQKHQLHLFDMNWRSVGIGIVVGLFLQAALFTIFFRDPGAFMESFIGPLRWAERAQAYHARPFLYFFQLLFLHEFPLLLGAFGLGWLLKRRRKWTPRLQFFALWTLFITFAYSFVQYKTPWCIPNLILPLGLFVAFAFDALWVHTGEGKKNVLLTLAAVILFSAGTAVAWLDSIEHPDRVRPNDYAFLQSDYSLRRFLRTLEDLNRLYEGVKPMPLQRIGDTDELLYVLTKPYRSYDSREPFHPGLPVYINYFHDDKETLKMLKESGQNYIRSTYMYIRDKGIVIDIFAEENLWNRYITEVAHEEILPGENPVYDYSD